jgi:NAD(P)H-hydrate epimerase
MLQKIFTVEKIREADQFTIENEPVKSVDLMERAAKECFFWLKKKAIANQTFSVFAGPGNNGGDGLVIARLLALSGFHVQVFILNLNDKFSNDFEINKNRLKGLSNLEIIEWKEQLKEWPVFSENTIIIDALFGSGLNKPLRGLPLQVVRFLNDQQPIKVAIDISSGLYADQALVEKNPAVFHADYTLSFQFPKLAFLMPENEFYVGEWHILDIGLSGDYISETETPYYFLTHSFVKSLYRPRAKFSHKGSYGHLLMIAGDDTKMGAAVLSSKAALKTGTGLVTLHHPKNAGTMFMAVVPEVMSSPDESDDAFSRLPEMSRFSNVAIGPGIGTRKTTAKALKFMLQEIQSPIVFDADAINILAENKTWLSYLPPQSVLSPHLKEFERLVGKSSNSFERMQKAIEFAKKHQVYLVIKGAHSMIVTPTSKVFFNSTGNPGMATGGSGDVLTGMIAGLMAQKYSPLEACLMGVYLHGLAGDLAAQKLGFEAVLSGDVIDCIGAAFKKLY